MRWLLPLVLIGCAAPQRAPSVEAAPFTATAMSVGTLQLLAARGPFPTDPCQAAWFWAVLDSPDGAAKLDEHVAKQTSCPSSLARLRLVQLARSDTLSWGTETRAADAPTRRELAVFAQTSKWDPGTSAVGDLVLDPDESVRVEAVKAVRALRSSIAVGQLEKSLSTKPLRAEVERALLCTVLSEFNIDVPPAACRGLARVEPPATPTPVGKPPPNLCRTAIAGLRSADPMVQTRSLLELAQPWVSVNDGCVVPSVQLLHLAQNGAAEVRATAAMLLLWINHPAPMRRTPGWPKLVVGPDGL